MVPEVTAVGDPKMWYLSTELWTAIVSIVFFVLQGLGTIEIPVPGELQGSIVIIILSMLRLFRTQSPLALTQKHLSNLHEDVRNS